MNYADLLIKDERKENSLEVEQKEKGCLALIRNLKEWAKDRINKVREIKGIEIQIAKKPLRKCRPNQDDEKVAQLIGIKRNLP